MTSSEAGGGRGKIKVWDSTVRLIFVKNIPVIFGNKTFLNKKYYLKTELSFPGGSGKQSCLAPSSSTGGGIWTVVFLHTTTHIFPKGKVFFPVKRAKHPQIRLWYSAAVKFGKVPSCSRRRKKLTHFFCFVRVFNRNPKTLLPFLLFPNPPGDKLDVYGLSLFGCDFAGSHARGEEKKDLNATLR